MSQARLKKAKGNKSTLSERFKAMNSAEKKDFLDSINEQTGRSEATIYRWIRKETSPSYAEKLIISQYLKVKPGQLF